MGAPAGRARARPGVGPPRRVRNEFPLDPAIVYLNHAGVAPWPRRAVEAVTRFARENGARGAADYPRWLEVEARLRERLAALINAGGAGDVALVKNTSEGLSIIARGLDWQAGDNVVGIAQEFPSNRVVWEALREDGVGFRKLDLYASTAPEEDLAALCDPRTRLVTVSSVQYARGLRLDLERLAGLCQARGVLLCVDAIQSLGAVPFDLGRVAADFVVADGHKWMLGPEGVALLYASPRARARLRLRQHGWHMLERRGDYEGEDWTPAADARRFECGSPNMLGIHALEASLSLLQEVGIPAVQAAIEERAGRLIDRIDASGFELLSPRAPARRAGIVTFAVPGTDPHELYRALLARGVVCAPRGGGIRFSPHFYTPPEDLERAVQATARAASALGGRGAGRQGSRRP